MNATPLWIRTAADLARLAERLGQRDEIALDTEGDSLHHYPERLALVQIADRKGEAWLIDPLATADLGPLGRLCASGRTLVVLHAGDNDLAQLKRRYRFSFAAIFDTSVAARFLGVRALGLEVVLREYLGVELPPSRQKDDWSARPLTAAQEQYAAADVQYLLPLKDRLREQLAEAGRLGWVEEECAALAAEPAPAREPAPATYARLKGARTLTPRQLVILKALWELRERLALGADRPPFKILSDATLVALALAAPESIAALGTVHGCTPKVVGRWGAAIVESVVRARALPERALPVLPRPARAPALPATVRRRIEALRSWRAAAAARLGLDPGVLLPNRLIRAIAESGPGDLDSLARVEGVRRWRVEALGAEIIAALGRGRGTA